VKCGGDDDLFFGRSIDLAWTTPEGRPSKDEWIGRRLGWKMLIYGCPKELHGQCEVPCFARVKRGLSVEDISMLPENLGWRKEACLPMRQDGSDVL
jgi:hypothetical protein